MNSLFVSVTVLLGLASVCAAANTCLGAGRGDPLYIGFHGQKYHFSGSSGHTYNIYNDPYVAVVSRFGSTNIQHPRGTIMSDFGIVFNNYNVSFGPSIGYSAVAQTATININGVDFVFGENTIVEKELEGCTLIKWNSALSQIIIETSIHVMQFTFVVENDLHINTTYIDFSLSHPEELEASIGGILGQSALVDAKLTVKPADWATPSLFESVCAVKNFYEASQYDCEETAQTRFAEVFHPRNKRVTYTVQNGDFSLPSGVSDKSLRPTGAGWSFRGQSFVAAQGATYTWPGVHNDQFAVLDTNGAVGQMSQAFTFAAGAIVTVTFDYAINANSAALRGSDNGAFSTMVKAISNRGTSQRVYNQARTLYLPASGFTAAKHEQFTFRTECAGVYELSFMVYEGGEPIFIDNVVINEAVVNTEYIVVNSAPTNMMVNGDFNTPPAGAAANKRVFITDTYTAGPWSGFADNLNSKVAVAQKSGTGYTWNSGTDPATNQVAVIDKSGMLRIPIHFTAGNNQQYRLQFRAWGPSTNAAGGLNFNVFIHSTFSEPQIITFQFPLTRNQAGSTKTGVFTIPESGFYYLEIVQTSSNQILMVDAVTLVAVNPTK